MNVGPEISLCILSDYRISNSVSINADRARFFVMNGLENLFGLY